MNKTPRLSKSGIEYLDYQWGIFSGCRNWQIGVCGGGAEFRCWAKSFANRFPKIYPNGFEPTYYPEAINSPKHLKNPSVIGVGWVGDIIGYCVAVSERSQIYQTIMQCPQHRFLFLTKNPDRIERWTPFPSNCYIGVTATDNNMLFDAVNHLEDIEASVKYLSLEPWLEPFALVGLAKRLVQAKIGWLILGSQTQPFRPPTIDTVTRIVEECDEAGVAVFLKDNLELLLGQDHRFKKWVGKDKDGNDLYGLRQEMPSLMPRPHPNHVVGATMDG